ncbi:MAG: hypothetical protein U9O20_04470 [Patescibacteria group bacterium]|nr:hypothetical protein [Patescibacteria group bacterium]
MAKKNSSKKEERENSEKIQSLQEMIATAERTISSAKQMLIQIQTDKKSSPAGGGNFSSDSEGQVMMGKFDGQIMIGEDGKQYPVPANYASKSKLVEGDMLKLTITVEGNFVYKQIGPTDRRFLIGVTEKDERGNFVIKTEERKFKVLLAAATYFKIELGDEVTIVVPRDEDSIWAAIENIVRKSYEIGVANDSAYQVGKEGESLVDNEEPSKPQEEEGEEQKKPNAIERLQKEIEQERKKQANNDLIINEWTPDIEQLKKEAGQPAQTEK